MIRRCHGQLLLASLVLAALALSFAFGSGRMARQHWWQRHAANLDETMRGNASANTDKIAGSRISPGKHVTVHGYIQCLGYDYPGSQMTHMHVSSTAQCAENCDGNEHCVLFVASLDGHDCHIKFRGREPVPSERHNSYIKPSQTVLLCPAPTRSRGSPLPELKGPILSFEWKARSRNLHTINAVARLAMGLKLPLFIPAPTSCDAWLGVEEYEHDYSPWDLSELSSKLTFFTERQVQANLGSVEKHPVLKQLGSVSQREAGLLPFYKTQCYFGASGPDQFQQLQRLAKTPDCTLIVIKSEAVMDVAIPNVDMFALFDVFRPAPFLVKAARQLLQAQKIKGPLVTLQGRTMLECDGLSEVCRKNAEEECNTTALDLARTLAIRKFITGAEEERVGKSLQLSCALVPQRLLSLLSQFPSLGEVTAIVERNVGEGACGKPGCECEFTENTDFQDGDFAMASSNSPMDCCQQCRINSDCAGAVFWKSHCYLKNDVSHVVANEDRTAVKYRRQKRPALAFVFGTDLQYPDLDAALVGAGGVRVTYEDGARASWGPHIGAWVAELERLQLDSDLSGCIPSREDMMQLYELVFDLALHSVSDFFVGSPRSILTGPICLLRGRERLNDAAICRPSLQARYCPLHPTCSIKGS